tara:strand:- start:171 stop:506 length:336 start_codon:yes stop_codon:yes gene_type:complete
MKDPNKNGAGVPLQFGGKAGRPSAASLPAGTDSNPLSNNELVGHQLKGSVNDLTQKQSASPEEMKSVVTLAGGVLAFTAQLGDFQLSASRAIVCICLPTLCVYAYFGLTSI